MIQTGFYFILLNNTLNKTVPIYQLLQFLNHQLTVLDVFAIFLNDG